MHSPTPNYGLVRPTDGRGLTTNDPMNVPDVQINPNWDALAGVPAPNSGTTLPQSGSYNLGDRFYKSDTQSIYVLICKDVNWGWYWRPVHDAISPWFTVPTTCLAIAGWTLNPVPTNPFAIALDARGRCYWRGVVGPTSGNLARNTSPGVFKPLPTGLRPARSGTWMLGHEPVAVGTNGNNLNAWQGARIYLNDNGDPLYQPSIRCFGGTADMNRFHLTGVNYPVGTDRYLDV